MEPYHISLSTMATADLSSLPLPQKPCSPSCSKITAKLCPKPKNRNSSILLEFKKSNRPLPKSPASASSKPSSSTISKSLPTTQAMSWVLACSTSSMQACLQFTLATTTLMQIAIWEQHQPPGCAPISSLRKLPMLQRFETPSGTGNGRCYS